MNQTPYRAMIAELASHFEPDTSIEAVYLPALTDNDLAIAMNHDDCLLTGCMESATYADILNASGKTFAERTVALGEALRADLLRAVRESLVPDVNDALTLWERESALERGMDEAGHRSGDFA